MSRGGSKPGERRGGRCKGTPNKKSAAVAEVLAGLGLDPIQQMGQIAMDERVEVYIRVQVLKEFCQYVALSPRAAGTGSPLRAGCQLICFTTAMCASSSLLSRCAVAILYGSTVAKRAEGFPILSQ